MKTAIYRTIDQNEVLDSVFSFLVKQGLESASIREICKGTGMAQGSLYYWFDDKTTIICEATEYGLKKVTDEIFAYVFSNISDLPNFFANCLERISRYKEDLRFIYQMVASPKYGERLRKDGKHFKSMYDKYSIELAKVLNYEPEKVKPIVYLIVSSILDYAVWDDKDNAQSELDFIYSILPKIMDEGEEKTGGKEQ